MDGWVAVNNLSLDWALKIADVLFNDATFEELLINQMWLSAHWREALENTSWHLLWRWRSSKKKKKKKKVFAMLMLPSFHPWPLVSSDCLLYKGGAGRVSVKGRQPDRLCLLSLACRPHPATMLGGVTVHGPVLLAVADQWNQGPENTETHTGFLHPHMSTSNKWKKSITANSFNALFCILNTWCCRPCFNVCEPARRISSLLSVN